MKSLNPINYFPQIASWERQHCHFSSRSNILQLESSCDLPAQTMLLFIDDINMPMCFVLQHENRKSQQKWPTENK